MARCSNCGRRIPPGTDPPLCSGCASCDTLYDAILRRLKRMLFSGLRMGVIFGLAALIIHIAQPFAASKLIATVLLYLALSEVVLTTTQFFVSYVQLRKQAKNEQQ